MHTHSHGLRLMAVAASSPPVSEQRRVLGSEGCPCAERPGRCLCSEGSLCRHPEVRAPSRGSPRDASPQR